MWPGNNTAVGDSPGNNTGEGDAQDSQGNNTGTADSKTGGTQQKGAKMTTSLLLLSLLDALAVLLIVIDRETLSQMVECLGALKADFRDFAKRNRLSSLSNTSRPSTLGTVRKRPTIHWRRWGEGKVPETDIEYYCHACQKAVKYKHKSDHKRYVRHTKLLRQLGYTEENVYTMRLKGESEPRAEADDGASLSHNECNGIDKATDGTGLVIPEMEPQDAGMFAAQDWGQLLFSQPTTACFRP
ncbi:hypothetical protein FOZ60_004697 [Perkinsus olseni]|uniref:Uncharacterized protein n=1 Tax=Perkinsus olseni TaxID=32597 RepID=A0A7J6NV50_PEROL|nr:hypothetical protein FOZ60_004697 [Perkinsus olseni]